MRFNRGFFIVSLLVLTLLFISAYEVFQTTGGTHFRPTEDVSYMYNFTVNNTDDFGDIKNFTHINVTLPSGIILNLDDNNNSNAAGTFLNFTNVLSWYNNSGVQGFLVNGSNTTRWFSFNATAANPGTYNISVLLFSMNGTNSTLNISVTINDTTSPYEINFTSPSTFGNYTSGNLLLNVSILDLGTMDKVFFNITNSSGKQNVTYNASNPTGNYWNSTLNLSQLPGGKYNITVWSNDTYNNANNTARVQITVDRTNPTGNFSCSPSSVSSGTTVTCSCASADSASGSGVETTAYTASPSVGTAGTFTETCTITDYSGNSIELSASYTVTSGGGSFWTGVSVSTWKNTYTYDDVDLSEKETLTREFKKNYRVRVKIGGEKHYVGVTELTETSATIEIASDPIQVTLDIGEDAKVDVTDDGFYDIYIKLLGIVDGKANLEISQIQEEVVSDGTSVETTGEIVGEEELLGKEVVKKKNLTWLWVLIGIIIIAIIALAVKKK